MSTPQKSVSQRGTGEARACIVRVGTQHLALEAPLVREVIRVASVTPLPRTDRAIRGLVPSRGRVLLLVDLAHLLGITQTEASELAVSVEVGGRRFAVLVDEVKRVAPWTMGGLEPSALPFARGQRDDQGELTTLLALDALAAAVVDRCEVV